MPENEWWSTIYSNLSLWETDDLIGHWQKHDEEEWTPVAFEVMEKILIERLGELPDKVGGVEQKIESETIKKKSGSLVELKTLINDNDPVFYDPEKISLLVKWIFRSINILIILYIIKFIIENLPVFRVLFGTNYDKTSVLMSLFFSLIVLILTSLLVFFSFKALGYVLKILKEMEINSRNPGK